MARLTTRQKEFKERQKRAILRKEMREIRKMRGEKRRTRDESSEYLKEIKRLFLAGEPYTRIGAALGKDHTTILYQVRKMGLERPKGKKPGAAGTASCEYYECTRPITALGLCHTHYMQRRRTQDEENRRRAESDPRCDHSTSRCECVNPGMKSYADYVRVSGMRLPPKSKDL